MRRIRGAGVYYTLLIRRNRLPDGADKSERVLGYLAWEVARRMSRNLARWREDESVCGGVMGW